MPPEARAEGTDAGTGSCPTAGQGMVGIGTTESRREVGVLKILEIATVLVVALLHPEKKIDTRKDDGAT